MSATDRIDGFIQQCQDRGFDPGTAFLLYKEMDAIAAPRVLHPTLSTADDRRDLAIFQRLGEALLAVQSPADWDRYCEHFPAIVAGETPGSGPLALNVRIALAENLLDTWERFVPQEDSEDFTSRLTTMPVQQGMTSNLRASWKISWERLRQVMQADAMGSVLGMDERRSDVAPDVAADALDRALQATSVRSVRWNWIDGDGSAQRQALAQGLLDAQAELHERTGWDGALLGLDGRVDLALGSEHLAAGSHNVLASTTFLIQTGPLGWSVVGHEWLHALDHYLGDAHGREEALSEGWSSTHRLPTDSGTPEQRRTAEAMNRLLKTLIVQTPDYSAREMAMAEARSTWAERMQQAHPWAGELIREEQLRMSQGTWERGASTQAWREGVVRNGLEDRDRLMAEMVVSEIEFLQTVQRKTDRSGSVWRQFLSRFDDNLRRHKVVPRGHGLLGYFQRPFEVLAHSFEATLPATSRLSDVHAGSTSLRYPTRTEGLEQAKAWRTFFDEVRPAWDLWRQPAMPTVLSVPSREQLDRAMQTRDPTAPAPALARRPKP